MGNLAFNNPYVRYEILNSKVVNMSPANTGHTTLVGNIYSAFHIFFRGKPCRVFVDGLMVHFSEDDKVVPDVMVVCKPEIIKSSGVYGSPDLIVEVLSPSTAFNDKGYKKTLYAKNGVREYWLVDPKNRSIEIYTLQNQEYILNQVYIQHSSDDLELLTEDERTRLPKAAQSCIFPDLSISLEDVFEYI